MCVIRAGTCIDFLLSSAHFEAHIFSKLIVTGPQETEAGADADQNGARN